MEMKKYKLGEYLDSFGDGIHGTPKYDEYGDYYFINGNNLNDGKIEITSKTLKVSANEYEKIKRNLNEKSLLVSINGTLGNIAFYNGERIALGKSACFLNLKESSCREYLRYVLETKEFKSYMNRVAGQSTIKNVSPTQISEFEFYAPPLSTQQKIAAVLSSLDDKIALNKKINAKLEAMAKRLYDYWFVQFDFPNGEGKPYKTSGGKMVWNEVLKREIPEGWEVKSIGDYLKIGNGRDHSKLADGPYPVYGSGGVMRYVAEFLHDGATVLFPRKGTLNNVMYRNEPLWTVDTMFYTSALIPHSALFVFYSAKMFDFERLNTGTGVPSMTSDIIKKLPIISPDESILKQFDKTVSKVYNRIHHNEKEIKKLTELRDRLLPLLMNGQVEVEG